jgi:cytochrome c553
MRRTTLASWALLSVALAQAQTGDAPWVAQARAVSMSVPPKLLSVLQEEIARGGPEGAILVCRERAPELARAASQESGWTVRRVSLRNRNPKAVPDAWERAALEDFDRRAAAGEKPAAIEKGELVTENGKKAYRYMKALPTVDVCLNCHGAPDTMTPAVRDKLAALYPQDKAVGYAPGQIRGAITIRKPL